MIVCFKEKHEDRYVQGPDLEAICAHVLRDRIADTYGAMYGDFDSADTVSVWYDEDTAPVSYTHLTLPTNREV